MSPSVGTSSRPSRSGWHIPSAVLYREWRMNRAWYMWALGAMLLWWAAPWMGEVGSASMYSTLQAILPQYPIVLMPPFSFPEFNSVVMGLLTVVVFQNDWTRGQLARTFEGPVQRGDVLRAKLGGLLAVIVVYALVTFVSMTMFAAITALTGHVGHIAEWTWLEVCVEAAVVLVTLAAATAIGHPILVGLTTAIWMVLPKLVASIIQSATPLTPDPGGVMVFTINPWATAVDRLSPLPTIEPTHHLSLFALYFLVWAFGMGYGAVRWWNRVPTERFGSTFFYPKLWNIYYGLLALASAFVVALILAKPLMPQLGTAFYVTYAALSVPGWFFWRWVYRRWTRSPDLSRPLQKPRRT